MKYLVISQENGCAAQCEIIASDTIVAKEYAGRNSKANPNKDYYINGTTEVSTLLAKLGQEEGNVTEVNSLHDLKANIKVGVYIIDGKLGVQLDPLQLSVENKDTYIKTTPEETGFVVEAYLEYKSSEYIHLETIIQEMVVTAEEYLEAEFDMSDILQAMKEALEI